MKKNSMQTITVLENILLDVSETDIIIDYSNLSEKEIKAKGNDKICKEILKNICNLGDWTCFGIKIQECVVTVSLNKGIKEEKSKISA